MNDAARISMMDRGHTVVSMAEVTAERWTRRAGRARYDTILHGGRPARESHLTGGASCPSRTARAQRPGTISFWAPARAASKRAETSAQLTMFQKALT